jgi:hypothetical protein
VDALPLGKVMWSWFGVEDICPFSKVKCVGCRALGLGLRVQVLGPSGKVMYFPHSPLILAVASDCHVTRSCRRPRLSRDSFLASPPTATRANGASGSINRPLCSINDAQAKQGDRVEGVQAAQVDFEKASKWGKTHGGRAYPATWRERDDGLWGFRDPNRRGHESRNLWSGTAGN